MKVVINKCFGGFSLSRRAVARMAELRGRPCFFFTRPTHEGPWVPLAVDAGDPLTWYAFDVPDPNEVLVSRPWAQMTEAERRGYNALYEQHVLDTRPCDRSDPLLVRVVEEFGAAADGKLADLKVVEVPDGVEWAIEEYDGREWVAEQHRTWE